ncbi:GspH/FimT family pseudopilin [Acinetobacter thermotolerans]|uniref:GspH/FimT family pseudopilin n=1 Tax=Acinetobacter thermotolerans TaxID=3151487 RepID=UPI00325AFBF9
MQRKNGFTLIELMVTIAVLGIIATIAAPKFQDTMDKRSIQKTTTDLEKSLTQARSDAVLYRKDITVHLGTNGQDDPVNRYWNPVEGVTLEFIEGTCAGGSWSTTAMSPPLSSIKFLPQGNVDGLPANLEITITNGEAENFISLTHFGRVSSSKTSAFVGGC